MAKLKIYHKEHAPTGRTYDEKHALALISRPGGWRLNPFENANTGGKKSAKRKQSGASSGESTATK